MNYRMDYEEFDIRVIDNFLPQDCFDSMWEFISSKDFIWNKGLIISSKETPFFDVCDEKYNFQFYHEFYGYNEALSDVFKPIVVPFIEVICGVGKVNHNMDPVRSLIRAKINFNPCADKIIEHSLHTDVSHLGSTTAVFYFNTNNGYTMFEDGTKIESVANRFIMFPCHLKHTGTTCTDQQGRYVMNINYF